MSFLNVFHTLLGWPAGIILGNLMASVVWSSVFEWRLRLHHKKTRAHTEAVIREAVAAVELRSRARFSRARARRRKVP